MIVRFFDDKSSNSGFSAQIGRIATKVRTERTGRKTFAPVRWPRSCIRIWQPDVRVSVGAREPDRGAGKKNAAVNTDSYI